MCLKVVPVTRQLEIKKMRGSFRRPRRDKCDAQGLGEHGSADRLRLLFETDIETASHPIAHLNVVMILRKSHY